MDQDQKFYQILEKRTGKFFNELIQYQKNYHLNGQLYLPNSTYFSKKKSKINQLNNPNQSSVKSAKENKELKKIKKFKAKQKSKTNEIGNGIKKPRTPYLLYYLDKHKQCAEDNPKFKSNEIAQLLGKTWRELPPEEKLIYKQKFDSENEKYWAQMLMQHKNEQPSEKIKKHIKLKSKQQIQELQDEFDEAEDLKRQIKKIKMQLIQAEKEQQQNIEKDDNEDMVMMLD